MSAFTFSSPSPLSFLFMQPKASAGHATEPLTLLQTDADSASLGCHTGRAQLWAAPANRAGPAARAGIDKPLKPAWQRLMKSWTHTAKGQEFARAATKSCQIISCPQYWWLHNLVVAQESYKQSFCKPGFKGKWQKHGQMESKAQESNKPIPSLCQGIRAAHLGWQNCLTSLHRRGWEQA